MVNAYTTHHFFENRLYISPVPESKNKRRTSIQKQEMNIRALASGLIVNPLDLYFLFYSFRQK